MSVEPFSAGYRPLTGNSREIPFRGSCAPQKPPYHIAKGGLNGLRG
jgi:hypothetical protein